MSTDREQRLEHRRRLKKEYGELYRQLTALLFRHDTMGINFEVNEDEYEIEVDTILPRLRDCHSENDVRGVLHQEFIRWFDAEFAGPEERYTDIAAEVWSLWQNSRLN